MTSELKRQFTFRVSQANPTEMIVILYDMTLQYLTDAGESAGREEIAEYRENVRRAICLTLEQRGIQPESSHHGAGPGRNLIRYQGAGPLKAADNMVTFQAVVRTMADQNGLFAEFPHPPRLFITQGANVREAVPQKGWQNPYRLMAALVGGQV